MLIGAGITAIRTLTCLPVPGRGAGDEACSLTVFPLAGALIGGITALAAWLVCGLTGWSSGAGAAGVIAATWITGGLHLDGLGDTADGFYGGRTRERRLQIMKDTHMGAFGTIAIILALLVKVISLIQLAALSEWLWIPIPFILSRLGLVQIAVLLPYARHEGGTAEAIIGNARRWHLLAAVVLAALCCMAIAGGMGLGILAISFVITLILALWMKRVFGGATGDLLGMANELLECALLFGTAAVLSYLYSSAS